MAKLIQRFPSTLLRLILPCSGSLWTCKPSGMRKANLLVPDVTNARWKGGWTFGSSVRTNTCIGGGAYESPAQTFPPNNIPKHRAAARDRTPLLRDVVIRRVIGDRVGWRIAKRGPEKPADQRRAGRKLSGRSKILV